MIAACLSLTTGFLHFSWHLVAHSVCEVFPDNVAIPLRFFHLWCFTPIKVKPSEFAYLSKGLQLCIPPYVEPELIAAPYMWVIAPRSTTSFLIL